MTNYEKWLVYTKNLTSPQSWIDLTWYFVVSAALQRRVWLYSAEMPLFPNQYMLLVGPPGIGKGLVLTPAAELLKHHRYEKGAMVRTSIGSEYPPLFPMGADSITFEELIADVANSMRRIPTVDNKVYAHCSYCFVLEEMSSLFKHKTSDVIKFLLNAYDCKEYEYKTKHQGKDLLRRLCFSFIAGAQPDFLKEASESKLFGQGFASRTLFIFESEERFSSFHISHFTEDQLQAKKDLLIWIKQLATLYGGATYSEDTGQWLEHWYNTEFLPARNRAPTKMRDYFARKKVIMLKLAMAIHFSETTSLTIPQDAFQKAIKLLDSLEPKMAAGLSFTGRNQLHLHGRQILQFIERKKTVGKREIILEFGADLDLSEIELCLSELELGYSVKKRIGSNNETLYYL